MKQTYTQKLRNILNFESTETTTFVSNICEYYEEGKYQNIRTFCKSNGNAL